MLFRSKKKLLTKLFLVLHKQFNKTFSVHANLFLQPQNQNAKVLSSAVSQSTNHLNGYYLLGNLLVIFHLQVKEYETSKLKS